MVSGIQDQNQSPGVKFKLSETLGVKQKPSDLILLLFQQNPCVGLEGLEV